MWGERNGHMDFVDWKEGNKELGVLDSIDNGVMRKGMQNVSDIVRCGHTNKHNREEKSELVDFTSYGNCHL